MTASSPAVERPTTLLPPRAMLLALFAQLPLLLAAWPLHPPRWSLALGAVMIATGLLLNILSERRFRTAAVGVCPFSPVPVLVRGGPFRFSRNPMYLGMIVAVLGMAFATGVLANSWAAVAFAIWLHFAYVLPEEQFLRASLEADFDRYAAEVPRWLLR